MPSYIEDQSMTCCVRSIVAFVFVLLSGACVAPAPVRAQTVSVAGDIPTPESVIGHKVGADYKLARWEKIVDYFDLLGMASDRVNVRRLGTATEGSPYILAEISSADTIANLDRYKLLQRQLADPRLIQLGTAEGSRRSPPVLKQAKTTILVSCGLHSSECAASQMAMELAYELASSDDPRTREILDNCIILLVPSANPDGHNKIVEWYQRYLDTPIEAHDAALNPQVVERGRRHNAGHTPEAAEP